jgi:hypothetical protein
MGISMKVVFKMASGIVKVGSSKHPPVLGMKALGYMELLYGHVIISSSDWIFEGQLPEANEVSNGKLSYPDGSFYEGQVLNFKRSGKGTLTDPAGGKTNGVWKDQLHVTNAIRTDSGRHHLERHIQEPTA